VSRHGPHLAVGWDRYGARYSWAVYALSIPFSLPPCPPTTATVIITTTRNCATRNTPFIARVFSLRLAPPDCSQCEDHRRVVATVYVSRRMTMLVCACQLAQLTSIQIDSAVKPHPTTASAMVSAFPRFGRPEVPARRSRAIKNSGIATLTATKLAAMYAQTKRTLYLRPSLTVRIATETQSIKQSAEMNLDAEVALVSRQKSVRMPKALWMYGPPLTHVRTSATSATRP
jgi:hypothetical protein